MRRLDIHWLALIALLLLLGAGVGLYALGYGEAAVGLLGAAVGIALPQAVRRAPESEQPSTRVDAFRRRQSAAKARLDAAAREAADEYLRRGES